MQESMHPGNGTSWERGLPPERPSIGLERAGRQEDVRMVVALVAAAAALWPFPRECGRTAMCPMAIVASWASKVSGR